MNAEKKEGPILRRTTWGRWEKNFIRIIGKNLCIYARELSTTPIKTIDLENSIIQEGERLTKKPNTFGIFQLKKTTQFFVTKDPLELSAWLALLRKAQQEGDRNLKEFTLSDTLESMLDAVVMADTKGVIVAFNSAATKLFGWKKEEIIGKNVMVLQPKSIAEKHDQLMEKYHQTGKRHLIGVRRELTAIHKDGRKIKVEISLGETEKKDRFLATFRPVKGAFSHSANNTEELTEEIKSLRKMNDKLKLHNELMKRELSTQRKDLVFSGDPAELFTLEKCIGQGSYGKVYKSIHNTTGGSVAIKVLHREVKHLVSEIETLMQLSHPNVVQYFGCYVCNSETWIVMEYCSRGCVARSVLENKNIDISEVHIAAILKQLLLGIDYMHSNKKIHRDIKAANLLISHDGTIKVADFSIAGTLSDGQKNSTLVGSPCWMAPEVFREEGYDQSVDIWSVGITAIELAQGHPPFKDLSVYQIMMRYSQKQSITLNKPKKWSKEFNDFISQCLQFNPAHRPLAGNLLKLHFIEDAPGSSVIKPLLSEASKNLPNLNNTL
eukprot:TRINITY_DN7600_c0_g3_i1.p1 TRINITY_DN7600_c0_g3~~TRINITY_DN7600_c0_g3_i1.p1  ORF type:complete len:551 (+),score=112.38 TRINITY_DN7600_c0_g3_i1:144-1796(+)